MRLNWLVVALLVTLLGWWGWVAGGVVIVAVYLGAVALPVVPILVWTYWHERRADQRLRRP